MDRLSPERRSWLMSRVRSVDTTPELAVRRIVFGLGYRYRLHDAALPGKPDLVFAGRGRVIFVHGCFWHGHANCRYAKLPKTRVAFWRQKIETNCERDARHVRWLRRNGWRVLTIWQCELRNVDKLIGRLHRFFENE
jgi:DNA mismatch endonuclease, patch repair protein